MLSAKKGDVINRCNLQNGRQKFMGIIAECRPNSVENSVLKFVCVCVPRQAISLKHKVPELQSP